MQRTRFPRLAPMILAALSLAFLAGSAIAQHYTQVILVSNQPGATHTDANLVNGWGSCPLRHYSVVGFRQSNT